MLAVASIMTVRLTVDEQGSTRRIRVEGRLSAEALGELEELVRGPPRAAALLLGDLRSIDGPACDWLRGIESTGVELVDVPPHLRWRIEADESQTQPPTRSTDT